MRLLLVEDEPQIAEIIAQGLREQGYALDVAANGPDALAWADLVEFDTIILDVMLPGLDGIQVCRTLRDQGLSTPILMLTARDSVADRVRGLDSGADDYLVKPFAFAELLARLRALTRRESALAANILGVDGLTLDTTTGSVSREGIAISLTSKEFRLLEFLLRRPNRVLTRAMIAEHLWSYDFENATNVIDVHVKNLRRKVDAPFPVKLIQTVRGTGYRIAAPTPGARC